MPAFQTGNSDAFEIPLGYVNQCNPGKNEVTLEFHPVRTCSQIKSLEIRGMMMSVTSNSTFNSR